MNKSNFAALPLPGPSPIVPGAVLIIVIIALILSLNLL